ncbi:MAG: hypothetical protein XD61_1084 [Thermococcus sp. 40_45]|nr:MAG: hypothetical protein XD61_1084 [Thermococcus sp. 40_45]
MRRHIGITVSDSILAFIEDNDFQKSAFFETAALFISQQSGENAFLVYMVGPRGFEPRTSRLSGGRSDQAEPRAHILVPRPGFEPGSRDRESRMIDRATPPGRRC